jgi:hypothetical protein
LRSPTPSKVRTITAEDAAIGNEDEATASSPSNDFFMVLPEWRRLCSARRRRFPGATAPGASTRDVRE